VRTKLLALGTIAYAITVFPITALWHVGLFNELYLEFGYFNQEETFLAGVTGLLNIFVQGFVLAALYSKTRFGGSRHARGLKFAALVFVFYFSVQVVNFVVRKEISDVPFFVLMEALYMAVQFGFYGVLMGRLYGDPSVEPSTP